MKAKILNNAAELFLNYGFKSVTMDDIAHKIGVSKKTIYQHFDTKTKLVEAATLSVFNSISEKIAHICSSGINPIDEVYGVNKLVKDHLKDEKSSPQYQLKKYYPKIFGTLKSKQFSLMQNCVVNNLNSGIKLGLYRPNLNIDFISRLYFSGMVSLKDEEVFPTKTFTMNTLMDNYLEYHLRGICTPKGLAYLNHFLTQNHV
ncbi:MAG: TetR/AcrR family transcriptional regulator [Flavobacteriaceae bacterium]